MLRSTTKRLIGVISDIHGLIRPEAVEALNEFDLIFHAGDVGDPQVLEALAVVAPAIAVRGNNDKRAWTKDLAGFRAVKIGTVCIFMRHDVKELDLDPAAAGYRVVISGHSHQPSVRERSGVLYVNPGSAGPRRFKLPISVARLRVDGECVRPELIELSA